jgi:hypothetical protein
VLRQIEKAKGAQGNPGGRGAPIVPSNRMTAQKTLSDLGITRNQSSQWQKLAAVPKAEFEAALADAGLRHDLVKPVSTILKRSSTRPRSRPGARIATVEGFSVMPAGRWHRTMVERQ